MREKPRHLFLFLFCAFTACTVGEDYQRPENEMTPPEFSETGHWKTAAPRDDLPKGEWWKIYNDTALDGLISQANNASPTLQMALAHREQARAIANFDTAENYPKIDLNGTAEHSRIPINRRTGAAAYNANNFSLPFDLRYEIDLWGRVRRLSESAAARVEASDADFANALLSVQADVAQTYFLLRSLDAERALVSRNTENRRRSLEIVRKRFTLGSTGELDTRLAETELAASENSLLEIDQRRTALRNALAVLCGMTPEQFSLDENPDVVQASVPFIPVGIPSELLERRPDIAAAEREMAAAHANIGVAKAAFYPSITLFGSAGFSSTDFDALLQWDSRRWSIAPSVSLPIFDGGKNNANLRRARAIYDEEVANYRARVLSAFAEVETCLSDLRHLDERSGVIDRAVSSSKRAAELVAQRYRSGYINYLDVTDSERTAIANERLSVQVRGQRLVASVLLIKAIGGSFEN